MNKAIDKRKTLRIFSLSDKKSLEAKKFSCGSKKSPEATWRIANERKSFLGKYPTIIPSRIFKRRIVLERIVCRRVPLVLGKQLLMRHSECGSF
ncbi:hypothetical protein AVEN_10786-1 [Araneus ventricosus]|uniref:Uncharacterized protein n=1 Tax=Araneus ventricosus TaxID=182803 RepID=A0A4Y2DF89_ARAVE|nr:hypothetical protein AVEN_10786-1 [Araneus ventricosus]